jgi:hypothetical protein
MTAADISSRDAIAATRRVTTSGSISSRLGPLIVGHKGTTVTAIQGVRGCLREHGPEERSPDDVTGIVDAGVNTRIRDKSSKSPQRQSHNRQNTRDSGSERKSGS